MHLSPEIIVQLVFYLVMVVVFSMKLATKSELKEKVKERDVKFEKITTWINDDFVRKDMCSQLHSFAKSDYDKMEKNFTDFRHDIRDAIGKLQFQMEALKDEILKRIPLK